MKRLTSRFILIGVGILGMMAGLLVGLGRLTIADGQALNQQASQRSTRTVELRGTRGRIMDRNGVVLAYSNTSYNVEFFRDPERRSESDSALYTESLIRAIGIIENGGGTTIDTFYIRMNGDHQLEYGWGVETEQAIKARYKNFCNAMGFKIAEKDADDMTKWPTAEYAYNQLRKTWQIPEEMTFEQASKVMSIRQEVLLNNFRAYQPITIAYDVSMNVVAEIELHKGELPGLQTTQSTSRVYPRGTTAAHILGYLSRGAGAVPVSTLKEMGYKEEQYKEYIETNKDGEQVVDMTKMGYSANDDLVGASGIERSMEASLTGSTSDKQGSQSIEVNKYLRMIRKLDSTSPKDGSDVMLTIDISLQQVTEKALQDVIKSIREREEQHIAEKEAESGKYTKATANRTGGIDSIKKAETGSIVVMDVKTGQVLAMASYPSYDPNMFVKGLSKEQVEAIFKSKEAEATTPMRNKAISAKSTPGSIFKMVTSLAGLMEGAITLDTRINCEYLYYLKDENGNLIENDAPGCWTRSLAKSQRDHANQDIIAALKNSCNYYFCEVANRLGITKLNDWAGKLGLTSATGIELPGESVGMVGGQTVLYDNTLPVTQQKTSLPTLVYNQIRTLLNGYLTQRGMMIDEEAVKACASRLLQLQDGSVTNKGSEVRKIISEELGIPEGVVQSYNWTNEITSSLTELQWKPTLTIRAGFGQGISLVTPVAVARYVAAIANGGTVFDAHVVNRVIDSDGTVKTTEPSVNNKIEAPQAYWDAIHQGLDKVVSPEDGGTAATAFSKEFVEAGYTSRISGKTGTAQTGTSTIDIENTSWFVTIVPNDKPEIVIIVCVPNGYSGSWSALAVEEIAKYYLDKKDAVAPETLVGVNELVP